MSPQRLRFFSIVLELKQASAFAQSRHKCNHSHTIRSDSTSLPCLGIRRLPFVHGHQPSQLVADLASCMRKGGAGFYARQGWAGGDGVWEWSSGMASESLGSQASEVRGSWKELRVKVGHEAGWRMRRRRGRGNSRRGSRRGGVRCSWGELQRRSLLGKRRHRRRCRQWRELGREQDLWGMRRGGLAVCQPTWTRPCCRGAAGMSALVRLD